MKRNVLIGGAWPYANYLLHIGHFAALLPGDVLARYYRLCNDNVVFVSGTDSHGTPITERARKEGKTPKKIAYHYHDEFIKSLEKADFSYDLFSITDSEFHKDRVKKYITTLYDKGYIYAKETDEDYCQECNKFLSDREIIGKCKYCGGEAKGDQCDKCFRTLEPNDLLERKCSNCGKEPITKKNKHLYFKLSAFQDAVTKLVKDNEIIWRKNAVNESKKFLNMGLLDRACTRQLDWGIEVPVEGYEDKRIYVWIEAVLGYITTCEQVLIDRKQDFHKFITDPNLISYYVHGKDNIPFHTIIYPALLMGIDKDMKLPTYIISSEYMNMNDEKMSKSKGNLITVNEMIDEYGADTSRYFMIAYGPEKKDSNFTKEDLVNAHNKFLVGTLGNFINRNVSFINKKFDGLVANSIIDEDIRNLTINTYKEVGTLIEKGELKTAIEKVFDYIIAGNKYYDASAPWLLVKDNIDKFNEVTYTCMYMIANISNLINPFMPEASLRIKKLFTMKEVSWEEITLAGDIKLNDIGLLFERIDL